MTRRQANRFGVSRIGINLLWLQPGVVGGSEEYTVGLLEALASLHTDDLKVTLYAQPQLTEVYPRLAELFDVRNPPVAVVFRPARFALESSWLAWVARNDDLLHHGGGILPYNVRQRTVVTIHDLQPLDLPQNFSAGQQRWFGLMLPRVARRADRIICPSSFTAGRVRDLLGYDPLRIHVVPPVHDHLHSAHLHSAPKGGEPAEEFGRYLLYPAMAHQHKRHVDAVLALGELRGPHPDLQLVFTGSPGVASDAIQKCIDDEGLDDRVHVLGRVSSGRLERLFRGAAAVVFPSSYEGFGNPVIEAMSRGVPVVAAEATALPEVAGGAAVLFEPGNPRALAAGVASVLEDSVLAERCRVLGMERAASFTRLAAGEALISAYRDALA